ncbi:MAG: hypothetical protein ABEJ31_04250 [Haloarculaceae archaeon]
MKRRQLLAGAGVAGALSLAGCSAARATTISDPRVEREDDGETHVHFDAGGEALTTLTVQPDGRSAGAGGEQVPLDASIEHREGTELTSLELKLRAPPADGGAGVPARVALTAPQWQPHPSVQLYTDPDDGGGIVAIDDLGEQGQGTVTLELLLTGLAPSTAEVLVDATLGLAESGVLGDTYTVEGSTRVSLPES